MVVTTLVSDAFSRPDTLDGLGTSPVGMRDWLVHSGSARISGRRAVFESTSGPAFATVDVETSDVDVATTVGVGSDDALYFRVAAADNWWRMTVTSSIIGTTTAVTEYEWVQGYTLDSAHNFEDIGNLHTRTAWNQSATTPPVFEASFNHTHDLPSADYFADITPHLHRAASPPTRTGNTRVVQQPVQVARYSARVDRCLNGTVQTLWAQEPQAAAITVVRVRAVYNVLQFFTGTGNTATPLGFLDNLTHRSATRFGIGRVGAVASGTAPSNLTSFVCTALNTVPKTPLAAHPIGGAVVDRAQDVRFHWEPQDPDPADVQSGFLLRYRKVGTSAWQTVEATTPYSYLDMPGGTFTTGPWEWQIQTVDSRGGVSPMSGSAFFTVGTAPAQVTITTPGDGQQVTAQRLLVQWTAPAQDGWAVRRVADAAGVPLDSVVYENLSGTLGVDAQIRAKQVTFTQTGRAEHVQVRVRVAGVWSAWASRRVLVNYVPPLSPQIVLMVDNPTASITLAAEHPYRADRPPVVAYDVWRRHVDPDGVVIADSTVRIAAGIPSNQSFTDYPAAATEIEYQVVSHGDDGTSITSRWVRNITAPDYGPGRVGGYDVGYFSGVYSASAPTVGRT